MFPHLLGTTYFNIEGALGSIAKNGPRAHLVARGLVENPIQKILADDPSTLEDGMKFTDIDVKVESGVIDILLQDAENKFVVVEYPLSTCYREEQHPYKPINIVLSVSK